MHFYIHTYTYPLFFKMHAFFQNIIRQKLNISTTLNFNLSATYILIYLNLCRRINNIDFVNKINLQSVGNYISSETDILK